MFESITSFFQLTGFSLITWQMFLMWFVVLVLFYFAIYKKFEPLLLIPIAFGALVANLPTRGMITFQAQQDGSFESGAIRVEASVEEAEPDAQGANVYEIHKMEGGLFDFISQGIKLEIFPPLIFLGVGALTDFGPLIANPRMLLLGAAAQMGVFFTFLGASFLGFSKLQAASIGIIGGADGPTAIFIASRLAPDLLGAIAVAAYSYMALVPIIQPPIMRALTTEKERQIKMVQLRKVTKLEKIVFPITVLFLCILALPDATPLVGALCFGNFIKESGVVERLSQTLQNSLINIVTIFLGLAVGSKLAADKFLVPETLGIIFLGLAAFSVGTAAGLLMAKLMNKFSKDPINPLIGSAGVSAVPMAARVSNRVGAEANPSNVLLMHAMGPNVAGVIGSAVAAGVLISIFG